MIPLFQLTKTKPLWVFIPVAIAIITNLHWSGYFYSHDVPKWLFIDILLSTFIWSHRKQALGGLSQVGQVYVLLGYWMLVSFLWSSHQFAAIEFLLRYALFGTAVLVLVRCYSHQRRVDLVLLACVLSAMSFSVVYWVERWLEVPVNNGAFTPIGFTNNAGHIFNIWIPALAVFLFRYRNKVLICMPVLVVLSMILYILGISGIRTTVFALGIGMGLLFVLFSFLPKKHKTKRLGLTITFSLLVALLYFGGSQLMQNSGEIPESNRFTSVTAEISQATTHPLQAYLPRWHLVKNSWDMLLDNPFGVGAGNFEYLHPKYAKAGTEQASVFVSEKLILRTPHNFLAKVFTELGWIGGLLFAGLYCWAFWKGVQLVWKQPKHGWVLVALTAFLIHSLLSQVFLSPMSYIFGVLLFSCLVTDSSPKKQEFAKESCNWFIDEERGNKVWLGYSLCLVLVVPALSFANVVSHRYHHQGVYQQDIWSLNKAIQINPGNDAAWLSLSRSYFAGPQDLERATTAAERFLKLNPNHIFGRYFYAKLLTYSRDCSEAVNTLDGLLRHYPSYSAAQALMQKSLDCRAREQHKLLSQP